MPTPSLTPRPMTEEDAALVCRLFNEGLRDAGDRTRYPIEQIRAQMTGQVDRDNAFVLRNIDDQDVGYVRLFIEEDNDTLRGELRFDLDPPQRSDEELDDLMVLLLELEQGFLQRVQSGTYLREVAMSTNIIGDVPWKQRIIQRMGFGSKQFTSELERSISLENPPPDRETTRKALAEQGADMIPCPSSIRFETVNRLWDAVFGGQFDYEHLTQTRWERQSRKGEPFHPDNWFILRYQKQWAGLLSLSPYLVTEGSRRVMMIHELGIHPSLRQMGLGGLLIDFALAEAKERHQPDAIRLYVATASGHLSRNLYQRRGFSRRQVVVTHLKRLR